jgi:hypothetical protein
MEHGLLLLVVLIFIVPCAVVVFIHGDIPYNELPTDPAQKVVLAEGFTVAGVNSSISDLPGALGGKTYTLVNTKGETVVVSTQAFDSIATRDTAVRLHNANTLSRGKQFSALIVKGQYLISVTPVNEDIIHAIQSKALAVKTS